MNVVSAMEFLKKNKIKSKIPSKTIIDYSCLLTVIAVSALWALLIFNKTAPAQEGWYVVYADMILNGMVPYVDFEFLYPPLYAYMSTSVVAIFGESLLAFRALGALIFVSIAVVTFFVFYSVMPSWIAAIGSLITVFALQADVFYISYDYHSVFTLFAYISAYFMLNAVLKNYKGQENNVRRYLFLSGIMCSIALSIRIQSGVILFTYYILSFLIMHFFIKKVNFNLKDISVFLVGIFIPILLTCIFLFGVGAFSTSIEMIFFGGTKGSIFNMLTAWIPFIYPSLIPRMLILMPILAYIFFRRGEAKTNTGKIDNVFYLSMILFVAIFILYMFSSLELAIDVTRYNPSILGLSWAATMLVLGFTIVLTLFFKLIIQRFRGEDLSPFDTTCLFLGGFAIIIAYGASTSGPMCYTGTALIFGLVIVALLYHSIKLPKTIIKRGIKIFSIIFVAFLIITIVAPKVVTPYNWWGSSPSPYVNAMYEADVEYFDGIWVSADEKFMYENFEEMADLYLGPTDELYCYSNIPIFYTLADKIPTVKCVVPWFDVSRGSAISKDLDYLKSNNPKMIVFNDHTMDAVNAHDALFGDKSSHYELYTWLLDCRDDVESKYKVVSTYEGVCNTYVLVLK